MTKSKAMDVVDVLACNSQATNSKTLSLGDAFGKICERDDGFVDSAQLLRQLSEKSKGSAILFSTTVQSAMHRTLRTCLANEVDEGQMPMPSNNENCISRRGKVINSENSGTVCASHEKSGNVSTLVSRPPAKAYNEHSASPTCKACLADARRLYHPCTTCRSINRRWA